MTVEFRYDEISGHPVIERTNGFHHVMLPLPNPMVWPQQVHGAIEAVKYQYEGYVRECNGA